jgi:hypothetical protein
VLCEYHTWPLRSYRFNRALCARQYGLSSWVGCVLPCDGGRVGGCGGAWTLSHCEACSTCALTLAKSVPRNVTMTSWPCRVAFRVMLTSASGRVSAGIHLSGTVYDVSDLALPQVCVAAAAVSPRYGITPSQRGLETTGRKSAPLGSYPRQQIIKNGIPTK